MQLPLLARLGGRGDLTLRPSRPPRRREIRGILCRAKMVGEWRLIRGEMQEDRRRSRFWNSNVESRMPAKAYGGAKPKALIPRLFLGFFVWEDLSWEQMFSTLPFFPGWCTFGAGAGIGFWIMGFIFQ